MTTTFWLSSQDYYSFEPIPNFDYKEHEIDPPVRHDSISPEVFSYLWCQQQMAFSLQAFLSCWSFHLISGKGTQIKFERKKLLRNNQKRPVLLKESDGHLANWRKINKCVVHSNYEYWLMPSPLALFLRRVKRAQ